MKTRTKILLTLGAVAASVSPVIPQDTVLKYSYTSPCTVLEQTVSSTSTRQIELPYRPKKCTKDFSVSVFQDQTGELYYVEIPTTQYKKMGELNGFSHNPTHKEYKSALLTFTPLANAAIARNATTSASQNSVTSITFAHTVAGSDTALAVGAFENTSASNNITGVTYNGVSMTNVVNLSCGTGCGWVNGFFLANPTTGTNNVVVSADTTLFIAAMAASYTGVKQTGQPEANNSGTCTSCTSLSTAVTTVTDNSWTFLFHANSAGTPSAGTNSSRLDTSANGYGIFDSGSAITPAQSYNMQTTFSSASAGQLLFSFAPSAATTPNLGEFIIFDQ